MQFVFNEIGIAVIALIFSVMGGMALVASERISDFSVDFIAVVKEDINGVYSEIKRKKIGVTQETFAIGNAQFVKDEGRVSGRAHWNRWGGLHPVLEYDIRDAKAMYRQDGKEVEPPAECRTVADREKWAKKVGAEVVRTAARPMFVKFRRETKPSSASTNLLFRRGGLKAMMSATKHETMDPRMVGLMVGLAAFAAGYLIFSLWHPGLVSAPPPGYYFKVTPFPINATVAH